jgi:hypothetical protein
MIFELEEFGIHLAGGYARECAGFYTGVDVDLFSLIDSNTEEAVNVIKKYNFTEDLNAPTRRRIFYRSNVKVEILHYWDYLEFRTLKDVLNGFPLTTQCFGVESHYILALKESIDLESKKLFRVRKNLSSKRINYLSKKYVDKGYKCVI